MGQRGTCSCPGRIRSDRSVPGNTLAEAQHTAAFADCTIIHGMDTSALQYELGPPRSRSPDDCVRASYKPCVRACVWSTSDSFPPCTLSLFLFYYFPS